MKVKELIKQLEDLDPEASIGIQWFNGEHDDSITISFVDVECDCYSCNDDRFPSFEVQIS